jgi:hypothetical protein
MYPNNFMTTSALTSGGSAKNLRKAKISRIFRFEDSRSVKGGYNNVGILKTNPSPVHQIMIMSRLFPA